MKGLYHLVFDERFDVFGLDFFDRGCALRYNVLSVFDEVLEFFKLVIVLCSEVKIDVHVLTRRCNCRSWLTGRRQNCAVLLPAQKLFAFEFP